MKKVLFLSIFIMACISAQAAYEIQTEMQISDNHPLLGKVIVNDGEKATLKFDHLAIELIPKNYEVDAVDLQANIIQTKNGEGKVLSRPRIITQLGKSAEISQQNDQGDKFRLKVVILKNDSKY